MESQEHKHFLKIRDSLFNPRHTVVNPRQTGFRKIVIPLLITGTLSAALGGILIKNGIPVPAYLFFIFQFIGVTLGVRRAYTIGKTNPVFRIIRWKSTEFLLLKLAIAAAIVMAISSSLLVIFLGIEGAYVWVFTAGAVRIVALSSVFLFLDKMIVNKATDIERGNTLPVDVSTLLYDRVSHTNRHMDKPEGQDAVTPKQ